MGDNDPPVAADDFPEFAEPPRHKPAPDHPARQESEPEPTNEAQAVADDVIARLRQKRAEEQK